MTDRELDALVAEKVMDRKNDSTCNGQMDRIEGCDGWECEPEYECVECGYRGQSYENTKPHPWQFPYYSTDIAAAWKVVERMTARPFSTRAKFYSALQQQATLDSGTIPAWPDVLTVLIAQKRVPRAICLAALKALGVEVKEMV